jgi:hypothetical protein
LETIEFSHFSTKYVFLGKHLKMPAPGTYDPKHFEPPKRRIYEVTVFDSGTWSISIGGTMFESGSGGARSKSFAKSVLEKYIERMSREF